MSVAPVITIDGPSGVGKGTMCRRLAMKLGWHYLDSGALYRLVALKTINEHISSDEHSAVVYAAECMKISFTLSENAEEPAIHLDDRDVTHALRTEKTGSIASEIAAIADVRNVLLAKQRAFRVSPGLVTDGRDMGTVVFPDAFVKFFLTASASIRAQRRFLQLKEKGQDVNLTTLIEEITARDERDRNRSVSPLLPHKDAIIIDTTEQTKSEVFQSMWRAVEESCAVMPQ